MKQKNKRKNRLKLRPDAGLVLGLLIVLIYAVIAWEVRNFPLARNFRAGEPMFYPLSVMIQSPLVALVVLIIVGVVFSTMSNICKVLWRGMGYNRIYVFGWLRHILPGCFSYVYWGAGYTATGSHDRRALLSTGQSRR